MKIPKGWHRLKKGQTIHSRDRFRMDGDSILHPRWEATGNMGRKVGQDGSLMYIRKNRRAK